MFILTLLNRMGQVPRAAAAAVIGLYQKLLSPDHGWLKGRYPYGFCRYYPSCSQYVKESILNKGLIFGIVLGVWRILRCNPLVKFARVDLPPQPKHH